MTMRNFAFYILKDLCQLFLKNSTFPSMKIGKDIKFRQTLRGKYPHMSVYVGIFKYSLKPIVATVFDI